MESLCQKLLFREIFGELPQVSPFSYQVRGKERIFVGRLKVVWVQAKDNFLAFVTAAGGLTVYNTLKKSEVLHSALLGFVLKAWFFCDTLAVIMRLEQKIIVYQIFLEGISDQGEKVGTDPQLNLFSENSSMKLMKTLNIEGISEVDVSQDLIILKYSNFFHIFSLHQRDWKIHYEGNARYTKGFILILENGKITTKNVKTLETHSFSPNFSRIFHIDIINSNIFGYNDESFCCLNVISRSYKVTYRSIHKYFEIENSGESLLVFSDLTSSLMTPEEVPINSCVDVFSVNDNNEHIFILSFSLFLVRKSDYLVQVVLLDGLHSLVGCNENDCEFFLADDEGLTICLF